MEEEIIQHQEVQRSDLFKISDRILGNWRLSRTAENKERLSEFSARLIRAIDEELLEPCHVHVERMPLELEQAKKLQAASEQAARRWERLYRRGASQRTNQRTGR